MKITDEWIKENKPCVESVDWWDKTERDSKKILEKLVAEKKYTWANWFIARIMTYDQYVNYAIFAAEQILEIYEKKCPNNNLPRLAIEAARKCVDDPSAENRVAAGGAAYAAYEAARKCVDDPSAENRVAARVAAYAAYAAADMANAVAYRAANTSTHGFMQSKVLEYGLTLLRKD